jgi:hypothetical protein
MFYLINQLVITLTDTSCSPEMIGVTLAPVGVANVNPLLVMLLFVFYIKEE